MPRRPFSTIEDESDFDHEARIWEESGRPGGVDGPMLDEGIDQMVQHRGEMTRAAVGRDELDEKVEAREEDRLVEKGDAPWVRVTPPSAYQGVLGGTQVITPNVQPVEIVNWHGADIEAGPITITLANTGNPESSAFPVDGYYDAYAVIRFGCRGVMATVIVDIGAGVQLTVGASSIIVQVGVTVAGLTGVLSQQQVSAMLSFYPVVRNTHVTRTCYTGTLVAKAVATFNVPAFAQSILPIVKPQQPGTPFYVNCRDLLGNSLQVLYVAGAISDRIDLAGDVKTVQIINPGPGNINNLRVVFALNL
jgi:hypothetical protein